MAGTPSGFVGEIEKLLLAMGKNAQDVASVLSASEIRGMRHTKGNLNPVVRYIQNHRFIRRLEISGADTLRIEFADGTTEEVKLPAAVRGFVRDFNEGRHPDLELG
jgi:hypothetical protein